MPEPLSTELVAQLLVKLHAAFPRTIGAQNATATTDVYRNGLRGLSGDAVRNAVDRVIENDTYFPKVARIRELANEWERRRLAFAPRHRDEPANPLACRICGAVPEQLEYTYPKRKAGSLALVISKETGKIDMETHTSERSETVHDARAHHVFQQHDQDVA